MIRSGNVTFNVIFVPDTVQYLQVLTRSVIKYSQCRFRLVSNACSSVENRILRDIASGSSRLEFYQVPATQSQRHGLILNHLQRLERSGTFAFMDSDVYATGEFLASILSAFRCSKAVFSCSPIWCNEQLETAPDDARILTGLYNRLSDGLVVGSTYCAVYDNSILTEVIRETDAGFDNCLWDDIPWSIRKELGSDNRTYEKYDTGKVLNILLGLRGHRLNNFRSETLKHVGGISALTLRRRNRTLSRILSQRLRAILGPSARMLLENVGARTDRERTRSPEQNVLAEASRRRAATMRHLSSLMLSLFYRQPFRKEFRYRDEEVTEAVRETQRDITALFREYGGQRLPEYAAAT